jgi:hypothetical protein
MLWTDRTTSSEAMPGMNEIKILYGLGDAEPTER